MKDILPKSPLLRRIFIGLVVFVALGMIPVLIGLGFSMGLGFAELSNMKGREITPAFMQSRCLPKDSWACARENFRYTREGDATSVSYANTLSLEEAEFIVPTGILFRVGALEKCGIFYNAGPTTTRGMVIEFSTKQGFTDNGQRPCKIPHPMEEETPGVAP